ncbi:Scr1 family TA system antitoxin-like transcriptional regulator [Streptomyces carminius]|uniref:Scr1 family TA system antitoxin-like transcriptional regulator n=1 Tax=Streptomyces carminius TaxID=2665496 RepID=UPI0022B8E5B9|nr:Scr1 family TA system antitoxin-like transcriptional regulator [Streptomyces carminius]
MEPPAKGWRASAGRANTLGNDFGAIRHRRSELFDLQAARQETAGSRLFALRSTARFRFWSTDRKGACILASNNPPRLSIQVTLCTSGAHAGTDGSFRLFTHPAPADMDICFLEQKASRAFIEEETGPEPYRVAAEHLRAQALSSPESMRMIAGIAAEFDSKG